MTAKECHAPSVEPLLQRLAPATFSPRTGPATLMICCAIFCFCVFLGALHGEPRHPQPVWLSALQWTLYALAFVVAPSVSIWKTSTSLVLGQEELTAIHLFGLKRRRIRYCDIEKLVPTRDAYGPVVVIHTYDNKTLRVPWTSSAVIPLLRALDSHE
jgi:hypothetical protein